MKKLLHQFYFTRLECVDLIQTALCCSGDVALAKALNFIGKKCHIVSLHPGGAVPLPPGVILRHVCAGVNVIKVLHLYFTRVAIVSLAENNSCTCKLQV